MISNKHEKIYRNETEDYNNNDACIAHQYNFYDKDVDIYTAEINGRYPDSGFSVNTKVIEMIFVLSGKVEFTQKKQNFF